MVNHYDHFDSLFEPKVKVKVDMKIIEQADKIVNDFEKNEFLCKPNLSDIETADVFTTAIQNFKTSKKIDLAIAQSNALRIINNYTKLLGRGAIVTNASNNDELNQKIKDKDAEILDLKLKVAKLQGMLEMKEKLDTPNDFIPSEVKEDEST